MKLSEPPRFEIREVELQAVAEAFEASYVLT